MLNFAAKAFPIIVLPLVLGVTARAQTSARDRRLITYAKHLPARRLESGLTKTTFVHWFRSVVGTRTKTDWEINDCGEQTGNPRNTPSNPPLCAQAHANLSDGRQVYVLIGIGTHKRAIMGRPSVGTITLEDHGQWKSFRTLRELEVTLRNERNHTGGNPTARWTGAAPWFVARADHILQK